MYDIGSRLKAIRLQRGLTQKELAAKVNKSVSAISSYESNAQLPPLDVLESLARVLCVSIDYIAGLSAHNTYSTAHLSIDQQELIDLLFAEFSVDRQPSEYLTNQQVLIIQKLILIFSNLK